MDITEILSELYKGERSNDDTVRRMVEDNPAAELAEFIVDAFNRQWITPFNLGLDEEGNRL
jgi:hypothetical protein